MASAVSPRIAATLAPRARRLSEQLSAYRRLLTSRRTHRRRRPRARRDLIAVAALLGHDERLNRLFLAHVGGPLALQNAKSWRSRLSIRAPVGGIGSRKLDGARQITLGDGDDRRRRSAAMATDGSVGARARGFGLLGVEAGRGVGDHRALDGRKRDDLRPRRKTPDVELA